MDDRLKRFGRVDFDVLSGRLSVSGQHVPLDRPCIAILRALLAEPGSAVGKDQLLEAGWPDRLVHENSLAKAIGRLRKALGEDAAVLKTVHNFGYQLNAEMADDPETLQPGQVAVRKSTVRRLAIATAVLGLTGVAALGLLSIGDAPNGAQQEALIRGEPTDALGRVLWVDDNPGNNQKESKYLERRKVAVYQAVSTEEALALLAMYEYRAVVSDMNRGDRPLAGFDLVREMRQRGDDTPFFLYTVVSSAAQRQMLVEAGGQGAAVAPEELYQMLLPLFSNNAATGQD